MSAKERLGRIEAQLGTPLEDQGRLGRRGGRVRKNLRLGEATRLLLRLRGDLALRQHVPVHAQLVEHPGHAEVLVLIPVSARVVVGPLRVRDRAALLLGLGELLAVDVEAHALAVVRRGHVVPAALGVRRRRDEPGQLVRALGAVQGEREAVLAIPEQPALLEAAVVLARAEDAAPLGGRVDAHPGRHAQLLGRQRRRSEVACDRQVLGASVEAHRVQLTDLDELEGTLRRRAEPVLGAQVAEGAVLAQPVRLQHEAVEQLAVAHLLDRARVGEDRRDRRLLRGHDVALVTLAERGDHALVGRREQAALGEGEPEGAPRHLADPEQTSVLCAARLDAPIATEQQRVPHQDHRVRRLVRDAPAHEPGGPVETTQVVVHQQVDVLAAEHDRVALLEARDLLAAGARVRDPAGLVARAVQHAILVRDQAEAAAAALERTERLAGLALEAQGRDPALGCDEQGAREGERALEGVPGPQILHVARRARRRVHGAHVRGVPGDERRCEVRRVPLDRHAAAHGPARDQLAVVQDQLRALGRIVVPDLGAGRRVDAVRAAVVRAEVEPAVHEGRRDAHRALAAKAPALRAGPGIEADDRVLGRARVPDRVPHRDRVEDRVVVAHRLEAREPRERVPARWPGPRGARGQGCRVGPRGREQPSIQGRVDPAAAGLIVSMGGPVLRRRVDGERETQECGTKGEAHAPS